MTLIPWLFVTKNTLFYTLNPIRIVTILSLVNCLISLILVPGRKDNITRVTTKPNYFCVSTFPRYRVDCSSNWMLHTGCFLQIFLENLPGIFNWEFYSSSKDSVSIFSYMCFLMYYTSRKRKSKKNKFFLFLNYKFIFLRKIFFKFFTVKDTVLNWTWPWIISNTVCFKNYSIFIRNICCRYPSQGLLNYSHIYGDRNY